MTKREREIAKQLTGRDGAYAVKYTSPNGRTYFRLRDNEHSPLTNIQVSVFRKMEDRQWVEKIDGKYIVDVPAIIGNYDKWLERKEQREQKKLKRAA